MAGHYLGMGLLAFVLAGTTVFAADDPPPAEPEEPIRLKKKDRPPANPPDLPRPEPVRPKEEKDKTDADTPDGPKQDPKEVLSRVGKNMRAAKDRLAKTDAGYGTRQIQRDILKDLDELIKQTRQQLQQQGGGGGGGKRSSSSQQQAGNNGGRPGSQQQPMAGNGQPPGGNSQAQGDGNRGGQGTASGAKEVNRLADVYKDVWGHLPEKLRMEMDAYAREKFMVRYKDLLEQYYATIAEKGRRQED